MAKKDPNTIYVKLPDRLGWMTTFSDMVTLLLTFFVMIIAMSSMDSKTLQESFGFFRSVAGPLQFPSEHEAKIQHNLVKPEPRIMELNGENLHRSIMLSLKEQVVQKVPTRGLNLFEVVETSRGLAIRVPGDILFAEGSAEVKKAAGGVLGAIAKNIRATSVTLSIEGQTDDVGSESSNWTLSLQRAISVTDFFVYTLGMPPGRFCVAGYGELKPIATNETVTGREKNRRVEIILLKDRL